MTDTTPIDPIRDAYEKRCDIGWRSNFELFNAGYQAATERATPQWQPIETAPHGKSIIVGYTNSHGKWRSLMACFYEAGCLMADEYCNDCDEDGYAHPGWYEECESQESILPTDQPPTHWQPLPPPPAIRQGGAG